jgi:hypothetical protein
MGESHSTANELLGPPSQVPVGALWQLNAKAMLNSDLLNLFPGVQSVSGGVAFVKLTTDEPGPPRGVVHSEYNLQGAKSPFPSVIVAAPSLVSFDVVTKAPLNPGPGLYDLHQEVRVHHTGQTGNADSGMSETSVEFAVMVKQDIRYTIDTGRATPTALAQAPAEPDAPPLPPNMSSAPILRPLPITPKKITTQDGTPPALPPAPVPASLPAGPPTLAPQPAAPAPTQPPPPLYTPDLKSLNPLNNAHGLPEQPAPGATNN